MNLLVVVVVGTLTPNDGVRICEGINAEHPAAAIKRATDRVVNFMMLGTNE
jgi:hypothetical protein